MFTPTNAQNALVAFAKKNKDRAQLLERIMRLETAHFTSKQYQLTGSAGMESGAWGDKVKPYFPNGYKTIPMDDNHPLQRGKLHVEFIVWDSVDNFVRFLSDYIDRHNENYAAWNSLDATAEANYRKGVASIKNRFIV